MRKGYCGLPRKGTVMLGNPAAIPRNTGPGVHR
ncbi:hypothetical protein BLAT2472_70185 [Burkholderia latens]